MGMHNIRSLGTHNTLDGAARGSRFADVVIYTEAIPDDLRQEIGETYDLWVCKYQKDLVIAVRKGIPITNVKEHYLLIHPGIAKVTPHRGIYWITFELNGQKYVVMAEHRINAAFPPFKRGEAIYRPRMWKLHTAAAVRLIRRWKKRGRIVLAGGDLNTPHGVSGYKGELQEAGDGFDRLGAHGVKLYGTRHMSALHSDHLRLRASIREAA